MNTYMSYASLIKPAWSPPAWVFGPVWTVLYILIAISFAAVFGAAIKREIASKLVWPFVLNLIFNFAFTPIQFGLQNNLLAALDILLVLGTLIWALWSVWRAVPRLRWVVYVNLPYLLWVSFATVLQLTITYLNF